MNKAGPNPEREPAALKTAAKVYTAIKAVAIFQPQVGLMLLENQYLNSHNEESLNEYPVQQEVQFDPD